VIKLQKQKKKHTYTQTISKKTIYLSLTKSAFLLSKISSYLKLHTYVTTKSLQTIQQKIGATITTKFPLE